MGIEKERLEDYLRKLNLGRAALDDARAEGEAGGDDINTCVMFLGELSDAIKSDLNKEV